MAIQIDFSVQSVKKKDETFVIASRIAYLGDSFFVVIWSEDRLQNLEYTWDQETIWATVAATRLSDLEEEERKKYSLTDAPALSVSRLGMWLERVKALPQWANSQYMAI